MRPLSFVSVLVGCTLLLSTSLRAQTAPPPQENQVFQNEYVRVFEVTLKPGELLPLHEGGNRVIYSLNNYLMRYHWSGKTTDEKWKAGDVHFHPRGVHAEENAGKSVAKFIIVERLAAPFNAAETVGYDMAKANPYNTRVLFDRDMAKVFETTLVPNDVLAMHYGLNRLVYSCGSQASLVTTTSDGKKSRDTIKNGGCSWQPAGLYSLQNAGRSKVKLVVFGFKK